MTSAHAEHFFVNTTRRSQFLYVNKLLSFLRAYTCKTPYAEALCVIKLLTVESESKRFRPMLLIKTAGVQVVP